jgi:phosphoglucosamine mutase
MGRQLFGTDGIRGVAGEFPLDRATTFAVGRALGDWALRRHERPEVVLGMDTRESGPQLAALVAGGLAASGVKSRFAGVITTPGIAYLARSGPFVAGVMISASHNPYRDNGIKVFDHSGYKLADELEQQLEEEILRLREETAAAREADLVREPGLDRDYLEALAATSDRLDGLSLVLDCANGAAYELGPELFRRLGAEVHTVGCAPDGRNINLGCGALHPELLAREVPARGAELGVAFDGDADRAIFVSRSGRVIDGDLVLFLCGRSLAAKGLLGGSNGKPVVVATVMSNLGLEEAVRSWGAELVRTPVGDKYVLEEMLRRGALLGGEQSGHVIFRHYATTGDGLLTALRVLEVMRETGKSLDELTAEFPRYPQRLENVPVTVKRPLEELPSVQREIEEARRSFGGRGRVLVRFAGTEPLARVMVEGPDAVLVAEHVERIAAALRRELGSGAFA